MRAVAFVLSGLVLACHSPLPPNSHVHGEGSEPAEFAGRLTEDEGAISLPAVVSAGEPFTLTVLTEGLDSCWASAGESVALYEREATVSVYDTVLPGGCWPVLVTITHEISLKFDQPGLVDVKIRGARNTRDAEPVTIVRSIRVE